MTAGKTATAGTVAPGCDAPRGGGPPEEGLGSESLPGPLLSL